MVNGLEFGKVENPTLDVENLDVGDFVYLLSFGILPSYGVIVSKYRDNIRIRHFENGFPSELNRTPKFGFVRKTSKEEALKHFRETCLKFENDIDVGDLSGAVSARKQYYLDGIISQLGQERNDIISAVTSNPKPPMTGIYVLNGIYTNQRPSKYLDGLSIFPRLSEKLVSKILIDYYPRGFGRIPCRSSPDLSIPTDLLVAYKTYEVPESALRFVKCPLKINPRKLISYI